MFQVTRFVVLPYKRQGDCLMREEAQQFYTLKAAREVADRLRRRRERVDLYEVTGWPVQDLWDRLRRVV